MPKLPGRCDQQGLHDLGEFLRGAKSRANAPFNCSAACGGYAGADKLAHCMQGCIMFICIGPTCGMIGKDDDEENNLAEWTGYLIAFDQRLRSKAVGDAFAERIEQCAEASGGVTCY